MNRFLLLLKEEDGATLIEYALIVTLISIAGVIASTMAGNEVSASFSTISSTLSSNNKH